MAWRTIDTNGERWLVQPAVEKRANEGVWKLVISFRSNDADAPRVFWARYPLESTSKASLFSQAENISDEALRELLSAHVA